VVANAMWIPRYYPLVPVEPEAERRAPIAHPVGALA
jgi:hypothetical protein